MTRYNLRRTVTAGGVRPMTVTTTNPGEVERWMWDALSARDTESITITREYVEAPKPKAKAECKGQAQLFDRETGVLYRLGEQEGEFEVYDHEHRSWVLAPVGGVSEGAE